MSGQAILLAFEAILGHRSAHSLATGPVMALPANEMCVKTRLTIYVPYLWKLEENEHMTTHILMYMAINSGCMPLGHNYEHYKRDVHSLLQMNVLFCFSSPFISPLLFTITPALSSK
jgi:hypothetical protein